MRGLHLGLGLTRSSSAPLLDPLTLSPAVWLDPSDLSTMFQSGSRASPGTPVAADGDPVGLLLDKSGNALDFTATGTAKPLYKTSGGLSWLLFDGVDDVLAVGSAISGNVHSTVVATLCTTAGVMWRTVAGTSDRIALGAAPASGNTVAEFFDSAAHAKSATGSNSAVVLTGEFDKVGATAALRINSVAANGSATVLIGTNVTTSLGSTAFAGRCYGVVHLNRAFAGSERASLETYLGSKCGLSL